MAGKVSFSLGGLSEMREALRDLGKNIPEKWGAKAVGAGAKVVRDKARQNVRKDRGNLKRAIKSKMLKPRPGRKTAIIGVSREGIADPRRKSGVDKPASRAHLEEFGTKSQVARPFLRPAMDSSRGPVLQKMTDVLREGVITEARAVSRRAR